MRSILEKSLSHLLNEDYEKATELFHKFCVERAKQIHESNRLGDEDHALDKDWDDENYFTEADLAADEYEAEEDEMVAGDELIAGEDDLADASEELDVAHDDEDAAADLEADAGDEEKAEDDESTEERLDDLQDKLDELIAKFDEMNGEEEHSEEHSDDEPVSEAEEEEAFDDITESIIDELKKVEPVSQDGMSAVGKKIAGDSQSPLGKKVKDEPKPAFSKPSKAKVDFKLEQAPKVGHVPVKNPYEKKSTKDVYTEVPKKKK